MSDKDGGPAFSQLYLAGPTGPTVTSGMTLRDYFAGQHIAGIAAGVRAGSRTFDDFADMAKWAYALADAMLKERAK